MLGLFYLQTCTTATEVPSLAEVAIYLTGISDIRDTLMKIIRGK